MTLAEHIKAVLGRFTHTREPDPQPMDPDGVLQGSGSIKYKHPKISALRGTSASELAATTAMRRSHEPRSARQAPAMSRALAIPCPDPTIEDRDRDRHQAHGRKMARQERWDDIAHALESADTTRSKTGGGMPIAELISFGVRSDVVSAAEHALLSGTPDQDAPLLDGIEALEDVLTEFPDNPWIATVVASAHMDIGWAWRGKGCAAQVRKQNQAAFEAHFDRAADILDQLDATALEAPLIASAKCALAAGMPSRHHMIPEVYDAFIDLDPRNPRALRSFGAHLLPRWSGTYDDLELQARRMAGRYHAVWGAGAYTWVMFDAISNDPAACARVDLEFFIDGLHDIVRRSNDQHIVNLIAAYCANTMVNAATGDDEADYVCARISECAKKIIAENLREVHPMLWAHAARGFDTTLQVRCADRFAAAGYADALRIITDVFRDEIDEAAPQPAKAGAAQFVQLQPA